MEAYLDPALFRSELDRVRQDVSNHLLQALGVPRDEGLEVEHGIEPDALARRPWTHGVDTRFHYGRQFNGLDL